MREGERERETERVRGASGLWLFNYGWFGEACLPLGAQLVNDTSHRKLGDAARCGEEGLGDPLALLA